MVYQVSDCPRWGIHSPLILWLAKAGPPRRLKANKKQVQKEQKYDNKNKPKRVTDFPRAECRDTNASCDGRRFRAHSIQAAKSRSMAGGDGGQGLRDLGVVRTGTGP